MKRKNKIILSISIIVFVLVGTPLSISLANLIHTKIISDDYKQLKNDPNYQTAYFIDGIDLVKQNISCGYAVMEMFGNFANYQVTEEELYENNNKKIVTSSTSGFENEMNKVFSKYEAKAYSWLKSTELIKKCYESLKNGIPVPFEMAYKLNDSWTLHFSLLIGIDLVKDEFRILNPYRYDVIMNAEKFINHTSYKVWKNMPFYLSRAFGLTIFDKNTIFISKEK